MIHAHGAHVTPVTQVFIFAQRDLRRDNWVSQAFTADGTIIMEMHLCFFSQFIIKSPTMGIWLLCNKHSAQQ